MAKFRKIQVVIEAEQYLDSDKPVTGMCTLDECLNAHNDHPHVHPKLDSQIVVVEVGDWIIPKPGGIHFYPCKAYVFEDRYEPV